MSKRKKKKIKGPDDSQQIWDENPALHNVIHKENWDFINIISQNTKNILNTPWIENVKYNLKNKIHEEYPAIVDDCIGLGKNKATIGIGAGQSFNLNKDVLAKYVMNDGLTRDWEDRRFITITANHQFKPLLHMGIIPDFVLLVDGSDVVLDQLTKDIPPHGKNCILITGLQCHPKVLEEWKKQGGDVRWYINASELVRNTFYDITKIDPERYVLELGGNVLNGAWVLSIIKFGSNVFVAVGNDLSYPIKKDLDDQRKAYYADGDYTTNAKKTGTGRDEAAARKMWAGFKLYRNQIVLPGTDLGGMGKSTYGRYNVDLHIVGTSGTLWVYKNWLESTLMRQTAHKNNSFHYYNCSEAGILGVMAKSHDIREMNKKENWFLLDEVCRFYHTAKLVDVLEHFEEVRWRFECQKSGVQSVKDMVRPS